MRNNIESKHQQAVVNWAWHTRLPPAADIDEGDKVGHYLFAIPNGGARSPITASILRAEGVKAGVHDLMLPLLRQGFAGLWIEMKAPTKGVATKEQKDWQARMQRAGYRAEFCFGWEQAANVIADYLGLPPVSIPNKIATAQPKGKPCNAC